MPPGHQDPAARHSVVAREGRATRRRPDAPGDGGREALMRAAAAQGARRRSFADGGGVREWARLRYGGGLSAADAGLRRLELSPPDEHVLGIAARALDRATSAERPRW